MVHLNILHSVAQCIINICYYFFFLREKRFIGAHVHNIRICKGEKGILLKYKITSPSLSIQRKLNEKNGHKNI